MKKVIVLTVVFLFLFSCRLVAEEISLTLYESIAIALRNNRDILLKAEDVKKAKEKIAEAKSGFLPTLTTTGSWTNAMDYYQKDIAQYSAQTTLKQYLYKGQKTINTIVQNKDELTVSQALLDKTKLETIFNVQKAFYTLLLAGEFFNLNKGILENTKQHLDIIETRYKNGEASESDILKIRQSLSNVQQAYEASLNQIESSQILLKNLLYLDEKADITVDGKFYYEPKELDYMKAFLNMMKKRPEIRQYEAQENADKRAIEIIKADTRPAIYASWDYYNRSRPTLTFSPGKGWQDYSIVGVTVSWPIFDGWATSAKVRQAIIDLKQTQLTKEKIKSDIALELKNAYLALKNAIAMIKAAETDVAFYKNNLDQIKQKYQAGIASLIDLEDANLSYNVAEFNSKQAIYDYIIAKASFEKAQGEF